MNSDAVTRELLRGSSAGVGLDESSAVPRSSGVRAAPPLLGALHWLVRLRTLAGAERNLALLASAALFVVGAWPLLLTEVPPYQDLPNHLATASVIADIQAYPEYVFNGFLKTNAALFTWLHFASKVTGLSLAARLFAALTLALNALVIPRFVLRLGASKKRMLVASLFVWPMVHNWFVSMGMLDFAFAVPLSLAMLLVLDRQRTKPTIGNAAAIVGLTFATWYAHTFPLLVVQMLVGIEVLVRPTWRARFEAFRRLVPPLVPAIGLALLSVVLQVRDAVGPMTGNVDYQKLLPAWELVYNLWAEWFWGFTNLSITSIVPCVLLAVFAVRGIRQRLVAREAAPVFFSSWALLALVVLYCFLPYKMTNWFHVNSRLVPYLWLGLALYLPERLPRWITGLLGVSAVLYSVGMGVDYVRLDRERREFTAGLDAVPEGAKLLPLLFQHKSVSVNTRNLLHLWGYYVVERKVSSPLVFAHSRSFPITYSEPPPPRFNHLLLEAFAPENGTPAQTCESAARYDGCEALFENAWRSFFADATPRFDHLLLWDPTPQALAMIPRNYERTFDEGRLKIYVRRDARASR